MRINSAGIAEDPPYPGLGVLCKYSNHGPSAASGTVGLGVGVCVIVGLAVGVFVALGMRVKVGVTVAVNGMGVKVGVGMVVSIAGTSVSTGAHEVKINTMNKTAKKFLLFIDTTPYARNCPNVCVAGC
jgi:hypothetical protein